MKLSTNFDKELANLKKDHETKLKDLQTLLES